MKSHKLCGAVVLSALVALAACKSGPPAIKDLKLGKDKDATQTTSAFGAKDTIYAVANIDNPPDNGKVTGRLIIVNVPGQQAGPIPGLETTLTLTGGQNKVNFDFTPPTAGWPDGKYQLQVVLADSTGAQKDTKSADFATSGNAAAAPATETTGTGGATDTAGTGGATDTAATTSTGGTAQ